MVEGCRAGSHNLDVAVLLGALGVHGSGHPGKPGADIVGRVEGAVVQQGRRHGAGTVSSPTVGLVDDGSSDATQGDLLGLHLVGDGVVDVVAPARVDDQGWGLAHHVLDDAQELVAHQPAERSHNRGLLGVQLGLAVSHLGLKHGATSHTRRIVQPE